MSRVCNGSVTMSTSSLGLAATGLTGRSIEPDASTRDGKEASAVASISTGPGRMKCDTLEPDGFHRYGSNAEGGCSAEKGHRAQAEGLCAHGSRSSIAHRSQAAAPREAMS
eukprot:scaffold5186_cov35-Tisochrysis_lutea.AAC.2